MADPRHVLGAAGEAQAAAYLEARGYRVLERNLRYPVGEIDIIARTPEGVLVFVEVRTRRGAGGRTAALESVDGRKRRRVAEAAAAYLAEHEEDAPCGVRIDVIAVSAGAGGRLRVAAHVVNAVEED